MAVVVAIFLVDSFKSLSPDPSAETNALLAQTNALLLAQTNALLAERALPAMAATLAVATDAQSFHPTQRAVVVNTLWFFALVLSLLCALLATLSQEWTREFIRSRVRSAAEADKRYSLRRLREQLGIERYGLYGLPSFIVSLLHLALTLFLVGMPLHVSTLDSAPAIAVVILCAIAASLYVSASLIPLFDRTCPYYTPLTSILSACYYNLSALLQCTALYVIFVGLTARSYITNGRFKRRTLNPRLIVQFMKQPAQSSQLLHGLIGSIIHRKSFEQHVQVIDGALEPPRDVTPVDGTEAGIIWARTGRYQVENPDALRFFALGVLNMENEGVPKFVANLRCNKKVMTKLAVLFHRVDSVPAAVGSIRFFQMLLLADNPADTLTQDDENWRWVYMDAFLRAYPAFVEQLGERNAEALRHECLDVVVAVCSLRWVFTLLLWRIRGSNRGGSIAMAKLQYLFSTLDSVANLRMCPVSSDHRGVAELFDSQDPRLELELASRNALTLLIGAYRCHWHGDWQRPDSRYLPKGSPTLWDWRRLFGPNGPGPKPAASSCLLRLLRDGRFNTSAGGHDPVTINALGDLASIVEFQVPPRSTTHGEHSMQDSSVGAPPDVCYHEISDTPDPSPSHSAQESHHIADGDSGSLASDLDLLAPASQSRKGFIGQISERSTRV